MKSEASPCAQNAVRRTAELRFGVSGRTFPIGVGNCVVPVADWRLFVGTDFLICPIRPGTLPSPSAPSGYAHVRPVSDPDRRDDWLVDWDGALGMRLIRVRKGFKSDWMADARQHPANDHINRPAIQRRNTSSMGPRQVWRIILDFHALNVINAFPHRPSDLCMVDPKWRRKQEPIFLRLASISLARMARGQACCRTGILPVHAFRGRRVEIPHRGLLSGRARRHKIHTAPSPCSALLRPCKNFEKREISQIPLTETVSGVCKLIKFAGTNPAGRQGT